MKTDERIEKVGAHIIKHYATHMEYARETSVLKKLAGTGLAPELFEAMDGMAEMSIVEGPSAEDAVKAFADNPENLANCFYALCGWYEAFHKKVRLLVGSPDLSRFIFTEKGLCCIDFTHVRPGRIEEDVTEMMAQLCFFEGGYTKKGLDAAKLFSKISHEKLSWDDGLVGEYLPQVIADISDMLGIEVDGSDLMELMWALMPERKDND